MEVRDRITARDFYAMSFHLDRLTRRFLVRSLDDSSLSEYANIRRFAQLGYSEDTESFGIE